MYANKMMMLTNQGVIRRFPLGVTHSQPGHWAMPAAARYCFR